MSQIEIHNLVFNYFVNKKSGFTLNVDKLEICKGSFLSILGPNGCGKSTLLKLITGLLQFTKGQIKIEGIDLCNYTIKQIPKIIAYVPQKTNTIFPYSVYEIVMMGRTPYQNMLGFENDGDVEIVRESMELLGISHLMSKGINELSGGEAQRVFIARAFAQKANILLLDEPNAHLDIEHQIAIFDILKKMNEEQGTTIVSVSHDLNLAGIYSTEVAFMENGYFSLMGNKKSVLTEENIKRFLNVDARVYDSSFTNSLNVMIKPVN